MNSIIDKTEARELICLFDNCWLNLYIQEASRARVSSKRQEVQGKIRERL